MEEEWGVYFLGFLALPSNENSLVYDLKIEGFFDSSEPSRSFYIMGPQLSSGLTTVSRRSLENVSKMYELNQT